MTHPKPAPEEASKLFKILGTSVRHYGLRTTKAALLNAASNPQGVGDAQAVAPQAEMIRIACTSAGIRPEVLLWGHEVMSKVRGRSTFADISQALGH